ncbi:MAG: serine/threonine-protein kinase [Planctomycetota bacterium]|jgi:serine/threonine-protein kinase
MRAALPAPGEVVAGHTIVKKIGEGGMGVVYEVRGPEGTAALKVLRPESNGDEAAVSEFVNEARATASVRHESVVEVIECGVDRGLNYILMELVDGPPLHAALGGGKRLTWKTATRIVTEVARALAHAHALGLIHRDVKPCNVLLTKEGRAKLIDFGIVKDIRSLKGYLVNGRSVGTAAYASPEQCQGKRLDAATDMYSLGATLYRLLTGRPPFRGKTSTEVLAKHVKAKPRPPRELAKEMPKALSKAVERMLAKRQVDRFPSMERLVHDLELIMAGKVAIDTGGPRANPKALSGLKSSSPRARWRKRA